MYTTVISMYVVATQQLQGCDC